MSTTSASDRTADDILYEILLKSGFPLTTPVEDKHVLGQDTSTASPTAR